jgi:RNA polymerase sigma factor (sigma-70 family)
VRVLGIGWRDQAAAEEAVQEAFARVFRRWARVQSMERPDAYVLTVAANLLRRRFREEPDALAEEIPDVPVDSTERTAVSVSVRLAIETLPPRQRQAVVLRYLADLPVAEVAEVMGCAVGTAKATLHHALRSLNVELEEDEL